MKLLVFQHIECEHPGILRSFLLEDRIRWHAVELDAGEPIPDLEAFDALWVMGGPMDVWEVDKHPWLISEKQAIRTWVQELNKPFLGVCLGHQLLADALGGICRPARQPEVGIMDIELTPNGRADPIFDGMEPRQSCLQWHSVEVVQPPDGAKLLARSPACPIQVLRVGAKAVSMQYHVEIEPDTVANWAAVPSYAAALEEVLGPGAAKNLEEEVKDQLDVWNAAARQLYRNFMKMAST